MTSQRKLRAHRANARSGTGSCSAENGAKMHNDAWHRHGEPSQGRFNLAALDRDERRSFRAKVRHSTI
jgi:hypothetical protein